MDNTQLREILADHHEWVESDQERGHRANLRGANLHGANLHEANLHGVNLYGATLYKADLHGANLREADLHGANLRGANLFEATLYKANLYRANLREANLRGANLSGATLEGVSNILSIGPLGSRYDITYAINHGDKIMMQCGCWWGDLDEFAVRVQEVHKGSQHGKAYQAAIEYIKAHAAVYWE